MDPAGLEAIFLANRPALLRFLTAHGAGDAAEDLLQELWVKISAVPPGPVGAPMAYLFRAANNLMIDRFRSQRQSSERDNAWSETADDIAASTAPAAERALIARQQVQRAADAIAAHGPRVLAVFTRHRVDGVAQRIIAQEMGLSLSTVEGDLRKAYAALNDMRRRDDEG